MIYLANPFNPEVRGGQLILDAMASGQLGLIDTPHQHKVTATALAHAAGVAWCADNGAFSDRWEEETWWTWLQAQTPHADRCLFAVAPDVLRDAYATTIRSRPWLPRIRALGFPVAYVAQDGLEGLRGRDPDGGLTFPVPWPEFDCLFIGGSTEWKLGPHAREIAREANERGKWVHVGRVNSERRYRYAAAPYPYGLGAASCDGTYLTFGPEVNLPDVLAWSRNPGQPSLF